MSQGRLTRRERTHAYGTSSQNTLTRRLGLSRYRSGPSGRRAVDEFLADLAAEVEPITRHSAARAAELRATHGRRLRLPDALVVAIAMHLKADLILTTDRRWPKLRVKVLVAR